MNGGILWTIQLTRDDLDQAITWSSDDLVSLWPLKNKF